MALNPAKVALAVQQGLSTVCASCHRYWEGRDRGLPGDACTARKPCASPLEGSDYPEYVGELRDFSRWCFICGEPPSCLISARGSPKPFGVCSRHRSLLPKLVSPEKISPVLTAEGRQQLVSELQVKKSIFEVIEETEAEFQKRDRERGLLPEEP